MKRAIISIVVAMLVANVLNASEDWRGNNRLAGMVVDKNTAAPVAGAIVKLRIQKGSRGGPDVTTDKNGKWAILGVASGAWIVDIQAPGYITTQGTLSFAEGERLPPRKVELEPQPAQQTSTTPLAASAPDQVKIGGQTVSREVAEAVEAGNNAVTAKNFKEAVSNYEKAAAALPQFMPIKFALARSYYGAGDLKKAVALMGEVFNADPTNAQNASLFVTMLVEAGELDRAKQILDKLPEGSISADALLNTGIVLMNKKQAAAAATYFTKAIAVDPTSHLGYYYRGLASIQQGKTKGAKADLQKVIDLAAGSDEAKEAKEYLKAIK